MRCPRRRRSADGPGGARDAALGLPGNPPAAAARSRNKLQARDGVPRRRSADAGVSARCRCDDDPGALAAATSYPAVLKPLALSGSRGVMRVDDAGEFVAAFERLRALLQSPDVRVERDAAHDAALIESFIPGAEYRGRRAC